jgi:hypothetical protein
LGKYINEGWDKINVKIAPNLAKNANSLQVVLLKTIKKGEEWLTNYGRDFWLIGNNYMSLDTKMKKKCREFYKISLAQLIFDESSEEDDSNQENDAGGSGTGSGSGEGEEDSEEDA